MNKYGMVTATESETEPVTESVPEFDSRPFLRLSSWNEEIRSHLAEIHLDALLRCQETGCVLDLSKGAVAHYLEAPNQEAAEYVAQAYGPDCHADRQSSVYEEMWVLT